MVNANMERQMQEDKKEQKFQKSLKKILAADEDGQCMMFA